MIGLLGNSDLLNGSNVLVYIRQLPNKVETSLKREILTDFTLDGMQGNGREKQNIMGSASIKPTRFDNPTRCMYMTELAMLGYYKFGQPNLKSQLAIITTAQLTRSIILNGVHFAEAQKCTRHHPCLIDSCQVIDILSYRNIMALTQ